MSGEKKTLEGVLERVTFVNEENGWSVVRLAVSGRRGLVTAVGHLPGVQAGENLRLQGQWVQDRKFGEQFQVETFVTVQPSTLVGMEKYLGSGLVPGIGRIMAGRLVKHFGLETLEVIELEPERLAEVEGVGPKRVKQITDAWAGQKAIREVMIFLQSHGVTTSFAVRIFKQYGQRAIALVKENPYRLATDIFGVGFMSADRIASSLGIPPESPLRAEAGVLYALREFAEEGHLYAPREELVKRAASILEIGTEIIEEAIGRLAGGQLVVKEPLQSGEAVFLFSLHAAECSAAERLRKILDTPAVPLTIDSERALSWFEEREGLTLAPPQRQAVSRAFTGKVTVITGGPGTGKTTILNAIVGILEKKGRRILLCAPTGRAAKRMGETAHREAKTIHRLLEFNPRGQNFERNEYNLLEGDLIIVDELSMVDILLFDSLLRAIPPSCQLVLVGDADQLPSVGPGSVLRELIDSGVIETVRLTEIFRQARESLIVVNAHRVNEGQLPLEEPVREGDRGKKDLLDFYFIPRSDPAETLLTVEDLVSRRIPDRFGVDPREGIQVLTPMHKGELGAVNLNRRLQELLNPRGEALERGGKILRAGDKVMQIRNNYDLGVFNGDLGRIEEVDGENGRLSVRFDDRRVSYESGELDELVLGYACSIHKSQGSEYPVVVIPLQMQHFVLLQRNLLYTAITRGRRLVVIVGDRKAVAVAVKNDSVVQRYTRLAERLAAAEGRLFR